MMVAIRNLVRDAVRSSVGEQAFRKLRGRYWSWKLRLLRYEPEIALLPELLERGSACLDVGANFGQFSHHLARIVGSSGSVYALEPIPYNRAVFEDVMTRLEHENVELFPFAAGAADAETSMTIPDRNTAEAFLSESGELRVQVIAIDDLMRQRGIERLDFIKIDVEGYELPVLKGARSTILRFRPSLLCEITEKSFRLYGIDSHDTFDFLRELGYHSAVLTRGHLEPCQGRVPGVINYFFLPVESGFQIGGQRNIP